MVLQKRIVLGLSLALIASACSHKTANPETPVAAPENTTAEPHAPPIAPAGAATQNWAYEGAAWETISPDYIACGKGKTQSPINLKYRAPAKNPPRLDFSYNNATAQIENTPHLNVKMTGANQLLLNGKVFALERVEFHSPSEHQLSKNALTMEIELIHKAIEGDKMAVVSIFAIEGKENPLFSEIWAQVGQPQTPFQLDPSRMIPPNKTYYRYEGSLTTPPCTEGVEWVIFNTPMELSKEQITAYRSRFGANARALQPLNKRKVVNY